METKENLKKVIGAKSLALSIVNITIGSGIFALPAIVAEVLGASAILAYFTCGALILLIALCFAELGSKTSKSGGAYTYIDTAFGPFAGFISNNVFWFGCLLADAAVANALVNTLKYFFPTLENEILRTILLFVLYTAFCLLNIRSAKSGMQFIVFISIAKLLPLLILVIAGATFVSPQNLNWETFPTMDNIGAASLLLFFAFMGLETPLSNGGEIKNPRRNVPLGILMGISLILVLYIFIQIVTQGILGSSLQAHKDAPLAAVASVIFGKYGTLLIIVASAIAMLGSLSGGINATPRILFAGARDGLLPKKLAKVHPRFFTPHISILVYTSIGFICAISGGFKQLAILASASNLLIYLGVVLSTIKMRNCKNLSPEKNFRLPGGIAIPLVAAMAIIWLLSNLSKIELSSIGIFIMLLSLLYVATILIKKKTIKTKAV